MWTHPLWEVEGRNPQRPKTAEHGEYGQAKVVSRWDDDEVIFALTVTGAVGLNMEQGQSKQLFCLSYMERFYKLR